MFFSRYWFRIPVPDRSLFVPFRLKALCKGRRDGKLGLPAVDQEQWAPFEFRVKQKMDYGMRHLTADWQRLDGKLHEQWCSLQARILVARRQLEQLKEALVDLKQRHSEREESHVPLLKHMRLNRWVYRLLVLALVVGEYPLNAQVFKILGENTVLTMLFAATLALSLPLAAHFLGLILKRLSFENMPSRIERVFAVVVIAIPFAVMSAVAYLREKYMTSTDVLETLGLEMEPTTATLVFLAINTLIFTIGTVASYYSHDPELDYSDLAFENATRDLRSCQLQIEALEEELRRSQVTQEAIGAKREALLKEYRLRGESIRDYLAIILDIYREQNMAARARKHRDTTTPRTFSKYPPVRRDTLPVGLEWRCDGGRPVREEPVDTAGEIDAQRDPAPLGDGGPMAGGVDP